MRSRPDVTVYLDPAEPSAGERLRVHVHLKSKTETPFDAIDVELVGREARYKRTSSNGKTRTRRYHRREIMRLGKRFPAGVLQPGTWDQAVDFLLPHDLPPTYRSGYSTIEYELSVHVHIPWWPDRHEAYVIPIRVPTTRAESPQPRVFTSQAGEHRGEDPVIELSLEDQRLPVLGTLAGAIALTGLGDRKLRRIEVATSSIETALVTSTAGPAEVDRRTWTIFEGTPEEGTSIPFRIGIPAELVPTFHSPFIRVDYALEVVAVVAFGRDLSLRVPVAIERQKGPRKPAKGLPLVGKQRHLSVWRAAAEAVRAAGATVVDFDPEQAVLVLDVRGIRIEVTEEHRESLGPCVVAEFSFPALGLDLRLAERRWTDFGAKLPGLDKQLAKRFTVRAREPVQAASLLDAEVREALEVFDEAALDDEHAVVVQKGGVYQVSGLERFLARTQLLAHRLAKAISTLPPPAALAPALPAFQHFAAQRGARLRVGDLAMENFSRAGIPLSLDHRWEGERPAESRLWSPRPERELPASWSETLTKATGREPLLEETRLGVRLPLVQDPEEVLATADAFAAAVASLAGASSLGPYR
ncbi:MAG TPA: arrestin family protein [Polyangium sp.]|nr:arrestin family protein [Polyangium sp.]